MRFFFKALLMLFAVAFVLYLIVPSPKALKEGGIPSAYETIRARWQTVLQKFQGVRQTAVKNLSVDVSDGIAPEEAPLVGSELKIKADLEKMLAAREPNCRLTRNGSSPIDGYLLEEYADGVVFGQKYGDSAELKINVPREDIASLEKLPLPDLPEITARDVRFYGEFPDLFFFKAVPYTVISQESYFSVQRMIQEQQRLYDEFMVWFSGAIGSVTNSSDIQILVFSDRALFDEYMAAHAPAFKGYSGLYTYRENRLITYHQRDSQWVKDGAKKIDEVAKEYRGKKLDSRNAERLRQWQVMEKNRLNGVAQQATDRTLRHEGAHQLFVSLGIQSGRQQGRLWLTEGLATFCEPEKIGRMNPERVRSLKDAVEQNRLVSFEKLLSRTKMPEAQNYAEAWSLVHMLMQPEFQAQFFNYLIWLRDHPGRSAQDPVTELTDFLNMDSTQLAERWNAYVSEIIR